MKALILSDEINQFHWSMLKSVLLVLSLLPMSQMFLNGWQATEGSSQIMVGFFAISLFSAVTLLSFYFALQATLAKLQQQEMTVLEQRVIQLYRYVPMLSLASMLSYLSCQL
ncbi:hypothetical protein [uncultured Acinetobacter sp.]|uniref:hypothetical protein n=1 Tax=uncultured Acinetobacter sp. TaxID=165433 RepID=UPI002635E332|nr:hypothetical protein [uncultured Acinetobacter sp.]